MAWRFTDYRYTGESFSSPVYFESISKASAHYLDIFDQNVFMPQARKYFERRAEEGVKEFNVGMLIRENIESDSIKLEIHKEKLEEILKVCAENGRNCAVHDIRFPDGQDPAGAVSKYAAERNLTPNIMGHSKYAFNKI